MIERFKFELFHGNGGDMTPDSEGEYASYEDYAALQQKLDAMAAENVALKSSIPNLKHVDLDNDNMDDVSLAEDIGFNDAVTLMNRWKGETPATDTYLNSVRADAIESVVDALASSGALTVGDSIVEVVKLAESIRSGTHDTADKAG